MATKRRRASRYRGADFKGQGWGQLGLASSVGPVPPAYLIDDLGRRAALAAFVDGGGRLRLGDPLPGYSMLDAFRGRYRPAGRRLIREIWMTCAAQRRVIRVEVSLPYYTILEGI